MLANRVTLGSHVSKMWQAIRRLIFIGSLLVGSVCAASEPAEVNLDYVAQLALERAQKPFHSPHRDLPEALRPEILGYDKFRQIEFRHDRALWAAAGLPFRIEFFHPGYIYHEPVHVNEFTPTHTQPVRFDKDFFDYHELNIARHIPSDAGYAGFRVLNQLNDPGRWDELGSFLGASYFRLLGKNQRYGESARGLALDSGEPDRPEEFPIFTDWWLGKPDDGDNGLRLYALLDSVSCTGAYEFFIRPGETTTASIKAILYFRETNTIAAVDKNRQPTKTIGLAPLTSMFWFGKDTERKFDDYRTEVHDSDGLLVHMGNGEIFWRPLDNPPATRHQMFHAPNIKGYGLLQRERNFAAYQDMFNLYHQVPSVWVEPNGNWGDGDLHLVELTTAYEGLDNIVAFWDPKNKPAPLQPFRFGYTLHWEGGDADMKRSDNRVVSTRIGPDAQFEGARQFVIDFDGPKLDAIPPDKPPVAIASCSDNAVISDNFVTRNPFLGTWRVILKMQPKAGSHDLVDLRCTLQQGTNVVGETWTYQWSPP
jgi:periplasmic glucans biosynthesis protein